MTASTSVRTKINKFAKAMGISPQHALQSFFAERFLARIEKSRYVKNLAIKGGTLMSSILGVAQRTMMDIDTTVFGLRVDENMVKAIVADVAATDVGDGIRFDVDLSTPGMIRKDDASEENGKLAPFYKTFGRWAKSVGTGPSGGVVAF